MSHDTDDYLLESAAMCNCLVGEWGQHVLLWSSKSRYTFLCLQILCQLSRSLTFNGLIADGANIMYYVTI